MNTIEALRHLCNIAELLIDEDVEAQRIIGDLLAAYDALVPTLDQWPSDAEWFTVDGDGNAEWHKSEPITDSGCAWFSEPTYYRAGVFLLPPDINWVWCKWPRQEAQERAD